MSDLAELAQIYQCIRENQKYQQTLKGVLLDTSSQLASLHSNRKSAPKKKSDGTKKRRRRVQASSCYKFMSEIKKQDDEEMHLPTDFTKEQLDLLATAAQTYGLNWKRLATELNESVLNCYRNYSKYIVKAKHFSGGYVWSLDDDNSLKSAVKNFGSKHWQEVANWVEGKSNSQCYHRWMKTLHPDIKRGKWLAEEDRRLLMATHIYSSNNWASIAEHVPNRTDIQCRERYCNVLNPRLTSAEWTRSEDTRLMMSVIVFGKKWSRVAACLSGRTDNQCWRRFKKLCREKSLLFFFSTAYCLWASRIRLQLKPICIEAGSKLLQLRRRVTLSSL